METTRVKEILQNFISGITSAEECFCLIVSLDGYDSTRQHFLEYIDALQLTNTEKYHQLCNIYVNYFEKPPSDTFTDPIGCSVENGYLTSDFGYELDVELASALSIEQKENPESSYASILHVKSNRSSVSNSKSEVKKAQVQITEISKASNNTASNQSSKKKKKQGRASSKSSDKQLQRPVLYWLRRDLRLYDNPALCAAASMNSPVILAFLWSESEEDPDNVVAAGGATKLWLHHALKELNKSVADKYENEIIFRKTDSYQKEIMKLMDETGAKTFIINDIYEPFLKQRDDKICEQLQKRGINCKRFPSYLLHEPDSVSTESLGMRGIGSVTHFMECCRQSSTQPIGHPLEAPGTLPRPEQYQISMSLSDLGLAKMPRRKDGTIINWAAPIVEKWDFGENGAWNALELFLSEGVRKYEKESCRADHLNTCRISPYLHFGQISPRAILEEARHMKSPKFLRKLAWRDLSYWLLSLWPDLPSQPTRVHYRDQAWSSNRDHLKAWQRGRTGFPLVDAAMRQLWLEGWINNYLRHVVASFLISYLRIHWVEGYRWFQDTLLDADVAINAMMWQNGGMSGLDQWNFVMHPVDAALTCDPDGAYVRRWCPEIASLPNDFIHQPWKCPPSILRRCGVKLGETYPARVLTDLEQAREQSLSDVVAVRKKHPEYVDRRTGNDLVPLPNGLCLPVITRMEFKYKSHHPEAKDNPHTAVLRGYRSRKRDEAIAFANERDFMASTMNECMKMNERKLRANNLQSFS
ncbi:deoxyribodipyrimidine photo-lyase-like [Saccostrea cucullata]|uniref:deoxyribodipyrimidine photo-lyase-like n=1 Tax=Saccostrea cuccullata TaxID=36930 RepID=UPI002ED4F9A2